MGILHRAKDHARPKTEHTVTEPWADEATHGTSRPVGDEGDTTSTAREAHLAVGSGSTVIGPSVPVAGVLDGDGNGNGEKVDASSSGTSRGTESTQVADEILVGSGAHVTGPEKVEDLDEEKTDGEEEVEDESKYPKGIPLAILTFGLCMATFVVSGPK